MRPGAGSRPGRGGGGIMLDEEDGGGLGRARGSGDSDKMGTESNGVAAKAFGVVAPSSASSSMGGWTTGRGGGGIAVVTLGGFESEVLAIGL
jgi:hypothetical protein